MFYLFYSQKFTNFFRITRVLFGLFRYLCDENIVLGTSCHLGVVAVSQGVELRGVAVGERSILKFSYDHARSIYQMHSNEREECVYVPS